MSNDLNLLPCPFCASERVGPRSEPALHIACRDCGAQLWGHRNHFPPNGERAAEAWNRRPQPAATPATLQEHAAPSDEVAELESLLRAIRPEYGAAGSRDIDVAAQQQRIDRAVALLARHGAQPADTAPKDFRPAFPDGVLTSQQYHDLWAAPTADNLSMPLGSRFAWHIGVFAERIAQTVTSAQPAASAEPGKESKA